PVPGGPGRQRTYRILPAGYDELRRWIGERDGPVAVRDALMVRLCAEAALGPSGLAPEVEHYIEGEERKLKLYLEIEQRRFGNGAETREKRLQHLVLRTGIRKLMLRIEIAREALDILAMPPSS